MPYGYNGKILKVNLNELNYSIEKKSEYFYRTFMGGSALATYFLLTEMKEGIDPLSPENVLVIASSVTAGAPIPGANRCTVAAKSPLTDAFGEAESGGFFSVELKKAGFDAIVIKGRSANPVYLWIKDGKLEFREATDLWNNDSGYAENKIREDLQDEKISILSIGQAGENQVRYACVVSDLRHTNGRTGLGAVFGSKNLKAIAVRGRNRLEFYDKNKLKEIAKYFADNMKTDPVCDILKRGGTILWDVLSLNVDGILPTKNFHKGSFDKVNSITFEQLQKKILVGRDNCFACPLHCKQVCSGGKYDIDPIYGGPEYETTGAFGSNILVDDIEVVAKAHELCNKYTLDTIETGMAIAFAMECYENGILTKDDMDGIDLCFGNGEAVLEMIRKIAFKEGFGAVLAEGSYRASQKIGKGSEKFSLTVKKQSCAMHEPRGKNNIAFSYALASTGAEHVEATHDMPFQEGFPAVSSLYPLGILKGISPRNLSPYKVRWYIWNQSIYSLCNTLSFCVFTIGPGRCLDLTHLVEIVKSVTGWNTSLFELMMAGERTTTLARMVIAREGFNKDDDMLPERFYNALENGPLEGVKLDKNSFNKALKYYYEMMGWDENGNPKESKLYQLNIADLTQF